jgi:quinol monooxygenase YgiN
MLRKKNHRFGVIAHIRGLPGKADELRRRLDDLICATRREDGCISCEMIENGCDSTEFTLLEEWSDEEAHDVHFKTERIKNVINSIAALLSDEVNRCKHVLRLNSVKYGTNSYSLAVC